MKRAPPVCWPACPFWDWAVRVYGRPGVAEACLDLQDRGGHDVLLVLFAFWLGSRGITVDDELAGRARAATSAHQDDVVRPLREVRRRLKARLAAPEHQEAPAARHPALVSVLRERIKGLELEAERLEILALAALVEGRPADASASPALGRANLEHLLEPAEADGQSLAALQETL